MRVTDEMVSRLLSWSLPRDFSPDCGICFDGRLDDDVNKNKTWPTGTNLFNAQQSRQLLEYVLGHVIETKVYPDGTTATGLWPLPEDSPVPQTFGQKAVGLTFNPSGDPVVNDLKTKAAAFIDACQDLRNKSNAGHAPTEAYRMASIAITEAQTAQMWAVKAATWKD